jgi:orotate phosphoribosyltransferase
VNQVQSDTAKIIANKLLDVKAIFLKPNPNEFFTWASGIRSPIYCDNRVVLSHPDVRHLIIDFFVKLIKEEFPQTELIAGVATAGIAHAALIAERLNLPMVYIRAGAKDHGRSNQIEGSLVTGQKTVIIEDLISTGGSSIKAAKAAKEAGAELLGLLAIFTYELPVAIRNFAEAGIRYHSLSNYDALLEAALARKTLNQEQVTLLRSWRENLV